MTQSADNAEARQDRDASAEVGAIGDLVRRLCVTKSNLGLYSFEHSMTQKNLESTWKFLGGLLGDREKISLDIHKNTILFEGLPIEERNPMVESLARDFRHLRVRGISFCRGIKLKELAIFFKMLTLSREVLDQHEGAAGLLQELGVENIGVNQARYVRLEEDQKVVSTSFRGETAVADDETAKKELLRHLWDALMQQQVDRDWLLEEVRSDPARAAAQIVGLMKYYDNISTIEDRERQQEAIQTLLTSVRTLGLRLAERDREGRDEEAETVANSLLQLERELKTRSAGLKTSRAASRFIQEITNTVTAFIDSHQADRIAKEFLKDEKGLKRTEQLLRQVVDSERDGAVVERLRRLVKEKGVKGEALDRLLSGVESSPVEKTKKSPRRSRRKRASKPVREKIARALKADDGDPADKLAGIFERELRGRLESERCQRERLEGVISRLDEAMTGSGLGLVLVEADGEVILATELARQRFGDLAGTVFNEEFRRLLVEGGSAPSSGSGPEAQDDISSRILAALKGVITGPSGELLGFTTAAPSGEE